MARNKNRIDTSVSGSLAPFTFICVVTSLVAFGLVSMFSSSYDLALSLNKPTTYFFVYQLISILVGLLLAVAIQFLPKIILSIVAFSGYIALIVFLILSLYNPVIKSFINSGIQSIMMIFLFSAIASLYNKDGYYLIKTIISVIFILGFEYLLLINNFISMFILGIFLSLVLLFYIGLKFRYFIWFIIITACPFILWYLSSITRVNALIGFIKAENTGSISSTLAYDAIIRGGGLGQGLGKGIFKLQREIFDIHTNYIFASITEELGLIGVFLIALFFTLFFILCFRTSKRLVLIDQKGYAIFSFGLTMFLTLQVIFNIGVNLNIFSNSLKTLLPLISYDLVYTGFLISLMGVIYKFMRLTTKEQKIQKMSDEIMDGDIVFFDDRG